MHEKSLPYNPHSNGGAKAGVKGVKTLLLCCRPTALEESLALLQNTCSSTGSSTSSALFFQQPLHLAVPVLTGSFPLTTDPDKSRCVSDQHLPLTSIHAFGMLLASSIWSIQLVDCIGLGFLHGFLLHKQDSSRDLQIHPKTSRNLQKLSETL